MLTLVLSLLVLSSSPEEIRTHLESGKWRKARQATEQWALEIAKGEPLDDEAQVIGDLALLRALAEAGAGRDRQADWYWWVSRVFTETPAAEELEPLYGEPGAALAKAIRIPEPWVSPPTSGPRRLVKPPNTTRRRSNGPPTLSRLAFADLHGAVASFKASVDEKGYLRAPKANPSKPFEGRPVAFFAALEEYRDRKPGATVGPVHTFNRVIDSRAPGGPSGI